MSKRFLSFKEAIDAGKEPACYACIFYRGNDQSEDGPCLVDPPAVVLPAVVEDANGNQSLQCWPAHPEVYSLDFCSRGLFDVNKLG